MIMLCTYTSYIESYNIIMTYGRGESACLWLARSRVPIAGQTAQSRFGGAGFCVGLSCVGGRRERVPAPWLRISTARDLQRGARHSLRVLELAMARTSFYNDDAIDYILSGAWHADVVEYAGCKCTSGHLWSLHSGSFEFSLETIPLIPVVFNMFSMFFNVFQCLYAGESLNVVDMYSLQMITGLPQSLRQVGSAVPMRPAPATSTTSAVGPGGSPWTYSAGAGDPMGTGHGGTGHAGQVDLS